MIATTLTAFGLPDEKFIAEDDNYWPSLYVPIGRDHMLVVVHDTVGLRVALQRKKNIVLLRHRDAGATDLTIERVKLGAEFDPIAVAALYYDWKEKYGSVSVNAD